MSPTLGQDGREYSLRFEERTAVPASDGESIRRLRRVSAPAVGRADPALRLSFGRALLTSHGAARGGRPRLHCDPPRCTRSRQATPAARHRRAVLWPPAAPDRDSGPCGRPQRSGSRIVAAAPLARRLSWWLLMGCAWASAAAWAVLLAASSGWRAVAAPLTSSTEYRAALPSVGGPRAVRPRVRHRSPHVSDPSERASATTGLVLWSLEHVGLRGPGWSAALVIAVGTSAVVAVATTLRLVAGSRRGAARDPVLGARPRHAPGSRPAWTDSSPVWSRGEWRSLQCRGSNSQRSESLQ